jgi:hypothetical protein
VPVLEEHRTVVGNGAVKKTTAPYARIIFLHVDQTANDHNVIPSAGK